MQIIDNCCLHFIVNYALHPLFSSQCFSASHIINNNEKKMYLKAKVF